jgi:hypothetical protein
MLGYMGLNFSCKRGDNVEVCEPKIIIGDNDIQRLTEYIFINKGNINNAHTIFPPEVNIYITQLFTLIKLKDILSIIDFDKITNHIEPDIVTVTQEDDVINNLLESLEKQRKENKRHRAGATYSNIVEMITKFKGCKTAKEGEICIGQFFSQIMPLSPDTIDVYVNLISKLTELYGDDIPYLNKILFELIKSIASLHAMYSYENITNLLNDDDKIVLEIADGCEAVKPEDKYILVNKYKSIIDTLKYRRFVFIVLKYGSKRYNNVIQWQSKQEIEDKKDYYMDLYDCVSSSSGGTRKYNSTAYEKRSLAELRRIAKEKGLRGVSTMKKDVLITTLRTKTVKRNVNLK